MEAAVAFPAASYDGCRARRTFLSVQPGVSEIFRLQASMLRDASEHLGSDFFVVVKREYEVGPTSSLEGPM